MTRILKSCAAYTDFFVKRSTRYISEAAAAIPTTKLKRSSKPKLHAMSITSIQYFCSPPIIVTSTSQDKKKKTVDNFVTGKKNGNVYVGCSITAKAVLDSSRQEESFATTKTGKFWQFRHWKSFTAILDSSVRMKASPQQELSDTSLAAKALLTSWTAPSERKPREPVLTAPSKLSLNHTRNT